MVQGLEGYSEENEKTNIYGSSHCGTAEINLTSIHKDVGSIPGFTQWVGDPALW